MKAIELAAKFRAAGLPVQSFTEGVAGKPGRVQVWKSVEVEVATHCDQMRLMVTCGGEIREGRARILIDDIINDIADEGIFCAALDRKPAALPPIGLTAAYQNWLDEQPYLFRMRLVPGSAAWNDGKTIWAGCAMACASARHEEEINA